jgi:magnesium-transporting ATPase (P-type)
VCAVSGTKDLFEDIKRHNADDQENNRKTQVLNTQTGVFEEKPWKEVRVGSIVKVFCDEFFPADLVLLSSSGRKGICYIETKNLDGETNLKHKVANKDVMPHCQGEQALQKLKAQVKCEGPSDKIYQFDGQITIDSANGELISLSYENFLLRGSSLRQTNEIVGLAAFTGHHTRIMKNSTGARTKFSRIEKQTNIQILFIFGLQCVLCLIAMIVGTFWRKQYSEKMPYLALTDTFAQVTVFD